jgi:hypothetical protein
MQIVWVARLLAVGGWAVAIPGSDATRQDAPDAAAVKTFWCIMTTAQFKKEVDKKYSIHRLIDG